MRLLLCLLPLMWAMPASALTPPVPHEALAKPAAKKKAAVKKKPAPVKKAIKKTAAKPKPVAPALVEPIPEGTEVEPEHSTMSARKRARVMRGADTLTFAREKVTIISGGAEPEVVAAEPDDKAKPKDEKKDEAPKPDSSGARHDFDTDIRSEDSLETDGLYSLEHMEKDRATLVVMKKAHPLSLPHAKLYKPVDILVVGADGTILAIMPDLVLATLEKEVKLDMPVKGLLYINGGEAADKHIQPKDRVDYRAFVADPTVLQ